MTSKSKNILWVDIIKFSAMFGVVLLHVAAPLIYKYGEIPLSYWWIANIYDSIVRACVPLFFMISGYLLLGKTEIISIFLKKRLKKVVIPLFAWSMIYILWKAYVIGNGDLSYKYFLKVVIEPVNYHLWFLYIIIGIYLYVPILRIIVRNSKVNHLYYFIVLWIISVSFIPFLEKIWAIESYIDLLMISGYGGYFVLGYLLGEIKFSKNWLSLSIIAIFVLIGFTAGSTYYLTKGDGEFNGYFYEYLNLNIILLSAFVFILTKHFFNVIFLIKPKIIIKSIRILSSTSLGIYLIHPIILYHFENRDFGFLLSGQIGNPLLFIPLTAIMGFVFSGMIVYIIQKVPIIKRIVP